ncbi:Alpha/Beta hydrolase protein [Russula emetica]|nr:Alpha/Beta hydrolase protein [Russula emetica]
MLLPIPLANLALSFLSSLFPEHVDQHPHVRPAGPPSPNNVLNFHLRHFHVATSSAHVYFADAPHDLSKARSLASVPLSIVTSPLRITRPSSLHDFQAARHMSKRGQSALLDWQEDEVFGPDVMRPIRISKPHKRGWYNLTDDWNVGMPVGWEPDDDGFRGYVFATEDNSTVVLTIKGTSVPIIDGGPTVEKDKLNDNLLFSCCCARVSRTWTPVCDCYRGGWKCDKTCVADALIEESLFYPTGVVRASPSASSLMPTDETLWEKQNLYNNITSMYPDANIWVIGHSLGGALASLLGITFGAPVVTFEPPGERMAAQRLHLPSPVRHFPS